MKTVLEFNDVSYAYAGSTSKAARKAGAQKGATGKADTTGLAASSEPVPSQAVAAQAVAAQPAPSQTAPSQAVSAQATAIDAAVSALDTSDTGVVHNLSFAVEQGEFVAIVGSNGAGKTTTSKLMNGLLKPSAGVVLVDGLNTAQVTTSALAQKIGMLFQDPDKQICKNTVREELAFGLELRGLDSDEIKRRVDTVIEEYGFEAEAAPFMLSRGERQMLALASVVVCEPELLILDEPTTGLDYRECMLIMERIKQLNKAGTTVVMICHDMEVVLDFASRMITMAKGRIIASGEPLQLFCNRLLMQEASILPPMMIDLACKLASDLALEEGLATVSSAEELLQALQSLQVLRKEVA